MRACHHANRARARARAKPTPSTPAGCSRVAWFVGGVELVDEEATVCDPELEELVGVVVGVVLGVVVSTVGVSIVVVVPMPEEVEVSVPVAVPVPEWGNSEILEELTVSSSRTCIIFLERLVRPQPIQKCEDGRTTAKITEIYFGLLDIHRVA